MQTEKVKERLRTLAKRTRDRNYRFRKLSEPEKRVRIAKDVIQNLEVGKLVAANAGYLVLPHAQQKVLQASAQISNLECELDDIGTYSYGGSASDERQRSSIQRKLASAKQTAETPLHEVFEQAPRCTVCAIGGVFVSAVLRADGLKVKDVDGQGDSVSMRKYLSEWFDLDQLGLMEAAFERSVHFASDQGADSLSALRAVNFGDRHADPGERMIAIMRNVVANRGRFRP